MSYSSYFFKILLLLVVTASCTPEKKNDHAGHQEPEMNDNGYVEKVNRGEISADTMKGSPVRMAMAGVGIAHIHLSYRSPGVKGRVIWGGLVPYGTIWAAGAHHPTHLDINAPIVMGNRTLSKGDYALFLIPGKKEWTVVINADYKQHMTDNYDQKLDLVRFNVVPQISDVLVPRLTYKVLKRNNNTGSILFRWEKVSLVIPFKVQQAAN